MGTFHKVSYRAGLFDPASLTTNDGITAALSEFSGVLTKSNFSQVLDDILDKTHIVELILSGLTDEVPIQEWILEQFPSSALPFETSFSYKLLSKLSQFFLFNSGQDETLRGNHQIVRLAPEILQSLLAFGNLPNRNRINSDTVDNTQRFKPKKSSQKEMKRVLKANRNLSLNETPFALTGVSIPKTPSDAIAIMSSLLGDLKDILKLYLDKIRSTEFLSIIQESFVPKQRPVELRIDTTSAPIDNELPPNAPTTATTATAFPIVQPLKSALYFDTPDGFGKWGILVSQRADRGLREHRRKAKASYDIIVKKIKELSNGHFSYDNQKRLNGPNTEIPIYEAKLSSDLRLVYQVDWVTGHDLETETQVLRIYGIYTHAQMDSRLWDSVSSQLSKRRREYRKRCLERKKQDGDVYLPVSSPAVDENSDDSTPGIPDLPQAADDGNQLHKILTLEKYITLSKELLDSIEADRDATFPFEVSKYEKKIIQHPSSCYVLGRSGTGKTTTMLFKMLWVERAYQMSSEHTTKPRQAFITQSRVLAGKVEELFSSYLTSLSTASQIDMDQRLARFTNCEPGDEGSLDENDNSDWGAGLPVRFSELEDKHFPLFLTLDRLYSMLEADIKQALQETPNVTAESFQIREPSSPWSTPTPSGKLITYDRFLGEYWPHFTQSLKRNFNPSLVFSEFMGIIQGSEKSVKSPNGFLDRRTYEDLSTRTQPTFSGHRSVIYALYESYRKMKNEFGDFDAADRTHAIIHAITKRQGILGDTFDFIYVDETQDNLLVDSLVLRMLCRNSEGLFWAGDTAQTISAGSAFRFEDLTAFLFQFEKQRQLGIRPSQLPIINRKKQKKPTMFHLAVNYRSHSGIVNCAHAVIEIISKYWRNSIDVLPRERGNTDGAKPIFFKDVYPGFMRGGHFLSQKRDSHDRIELGADQCILVRDEAAKQRLESELGKIGIIITIYDSKGLEFNDVFLYNFFHDSSVEASQWRVILNCISPKDLQHGSSTAVPTFNPVRHAAICSELKSLYVAITRARNTLRIADESLKGEPMRAFWEHNNQIRTCRPNDDLSDFAVPSSKYEWAKRALELSRNQKFELARDSYEKAGKPEEAAFQNAHHLCQLATRTPSGSRDRLREAAFLSAAEAFQSCARTSWRTQRKRTCYLLSADCFEQADQILSAAKTYRLGEDFTKASRLFRKLGMFDDVHEIILKHGQKLDDLESIRDVVRLYYVNQQKFKKAHQLFTTVDEEIEYLEDRELDLAHLDLLLLHGRKSEAADLHLSEGRFLQAIDLLIEDSPRDNNLTKRVVECILQGLWQNLSVGVTERPEHFDFEDYLNRFNVLDQSGIDPSDLFEFDMFQAIASRELGKLEQLGKLLREAGRTEAAFLSFDYFYSQTPALETMDITQLASSLRQFLQYVEVLHELAFTADPPEPQILKLFGVKRSGDGFFVPPTALLSRPISLTAEEDRHISQVLVKEEFIDRFRTRLQDRLLDRVTRESDVCRKAFALSICLRHVSYTKCDETTCTRTHVSPDYSWLRDWISVHLLQILIYDTISRIQFPAQMQSERRYWIRKLHEAFNPPYYSLGPRYHLDCNLGVDIRKAMVVVIHWARAISFNLDYWPASSFLTIVMQTADLAFTFDKKEASVYVYRSGYLNSLETPFVFFREGGQKNILQELLVSFNGKGPTSLLMGILFIRQVVEEQIPIDINVFFSFIERICTLIIMFNRYRYSQNLDTVILPRGWITLALKQFDPLEASQQDSPRFWLMLQPLHAIIERLYFCRSAEHLLFGHEMRSISSQGTTVRSIYISRICRVLGLLGSNIRVPNFQAEIHSGITSLRRNLKPNHGFPRIYGSYIYAENFFQIAKITRRSMQGSSLDEMIQLLHSAHLRRPVHDIFGLRRIVYTKEEDLIPLLNTFNEEQPSESDRSASLSNLGNGVEIPQEIDAEDALIDSKDTEDAEEADPSFIPETEIPKDVCVGHTEADLKAAFIMQNFGRKVVQRMRLTRIDGLNGEICRLFSLCLKNTESVPGMRHGFPRYKPIYLGFIPPLIACFDAVFSLISTRKTSLKNRMLCIIGHEELDEVSCTLTRINFLLKSIKRHKSVLHPESDVHRRVDVDALKKHIKVCLDLLSDLQLAIELPAEIQTELQIIHKGVVRQPKPPRKTQKNPQRPALKVGDDDETEYLRGLNPDTKMRIYST